MNNNLIQSITIKSLWGEYNLQWDLLNPDVNILVGINGSGKSTVLRKTIAYIIIFIVLNGEEIVHYIIDEPETSLHIEWQQKLIAVMRAVNPTCQFIISSHSPSIFGKGWMGKVVHIEKLKA
jgi:predicted ATP-binding protein involved in virulence